MRKVFVDTNRGSFPYNDWIAYAKQLGAVIFSTIDGVSMAKKEDGALVGKWNHNSYIGWVRSAPEIAADPQGERS